MTKDEFYNIGIDDIILKGNKFFTICGVYYEFCPKEKQQVLQKYDLIDENYKVVSLTEKNYTKFNVIKGKD